MRTKKTTYKSGVRCMIRCTLCLFSTHKTDLLVTFLITGLSTKANLKVTKTFRTTCSGLFISTYKWRRGYCEREIRCCRCPVWLTKKFLLSSTFCWVLNGCKSLLDMYFMNCQMYLSIFISNSSMVNSSTKLPYVACALHCVHMW